MEIWGYNLGIQFGESIVTFCGAKVSGSRRSFGAERTGGAQLTDGIQASSKWT